MSFTYTRKLLIKFGVFFSFLIRYYDPVTAESVVINTLILSIFLV